MLPNVRAGRKIRRPGWSKGDYLFREKEYHEQLTKVSSPSYSSWPSSVRDQVDILAEDWELVPEVHSHQVLYTHLVRGVDILLSELAEVHKVNRQKALDRTEKKPRDWSWEKERDDTIATLTKDAVALLIRTMYPMSVEEKANLFISASAMVVSAMSEVVHIHEGPTGEKKIREVMEK